ncbi:hypothetical protein DFQ28_011524 [Apophysomyces sp. BC1034]|nr:hypothetical protein DFQ28_011524 [Apophysomyces sp. BC1034]
MMEEAVEQRGSQRAVVVEDLGPVLERAIRANDCRAVLMALTDDLKQRVGALFVDGQISQFIDDQDVRFDVAAQFAFEPALRVCGVHRVDDIYRGGEQHRVATQTGGMAERDTQVAFAEPDATEEDYVGVLFDEVQAKQILDLQAIDLAGPIPFELIERFEHRETGERDAPSDTAILAMMCFTLDQMGQVVDMQPMLGRRVGGQCFVMLQHVAQVQLRELRAQWIDGLFGLVRGGVTFSFRHGAAPVRSATDRVARVRCPANPDGDRSCAHGGRSASCRGRYRGGRANSDSRLSGASGG